MTKTRSTKRALMLSMLSLLMCCTMLIGTTFAWFTDTVTSGNNKIVAGKLDVELYHTNSTVTTPETVEGATNLFTDVTLWEPGAVAYENFTVVNKGTLALKYQLAINFANATETAPGSGKTLADVLKVAVITGGFDGNRDAAHQLAYNYSLSTFALEGKLPATTDSDVYGVVIYWQPGANDNDYNVDTELSIDLGVKLVATQLNAEEDSFGSEYDVEADEELPALPDDAPVNAAINEDGSASMEAAEAPSATINKTVVDAPAGAFKTTDNVEMTVNTANTLFDVNAAGGVVATLDIDMKVNGAETSADLATGYYTVTTYISKGLANVTVAYTGNDGKAQPQNVTYDAVTGKLTFQTNHFSNYAVSASALAYDAVNDTALTTIEQVVASSAVAGNTVVIPEVNAETIKTEIEKLPEDQKEAAVAVTSAAKIGNVAYATLSEAFAAAEDNDTIVVQSNMALNQMITNTKVITLDLNGKTIAGIDNATGSFGLITNKGTLTITGNGTMTLVATNNRAWNAYSSVISNTVGGKLIVENGTLEHLGGTDMAYGIDNLTNGKGTYAETVINGGTVKSPYRAIRMFLNGIEAQNILTINGGVIEGDNKSVWMQDPSANANTGKLTVSDKAILNGDVYLFVTAGSKEWPVEVSIANAAVNGKVISGNVPTGYAVVQENNVWTVLSGEAVTVVSTADELIAALEGDADYIQLANDIKINPANMSNAYGTTGINIKNGETLDGNGHTLNIKGAGGTWDSGINTTGGVIKNITVTGSFRGIFVNHTSTYSETVVLENVVLEGVTYTISCDQGLNQNLEAYNCTFKGWTSFAATLGNAKFVDCTFAEGSGYAYCRPYAPTEFVNCEFEAGYRMDPRAAVTLEGCTLNGVAVTAENLGTLVTSNLANASVK